MFENRHGLVDAISDSYASCIVSPPASPPGSPARSPSRPFTSPRADRAGSFLGVRPTNLGRHLVLPEKVKEAMMEPWSRETCLAAIAAAAPKSISLSGSRTSPSQALVAGNNQQILAAAAATHNAHTNAVRNPSLVPSVPQLPANYRQQAFGTRLHSQSPGRRGSPGGSSHGQVSSSTDARGTLRVDDLKRALATGGTAAGLTTTSFFHGRSPTTENEDTGSDSLVDADDVDFGSDQGSLAAPPAPNRLDHLFDHPSTAPPATVAVPETVPEDASLVAPARTDNPPVLTLPSDAVTDGRLPTSAAPASPTRRPGSSRATAAANGSVSGRRSVRGGNAAPGHGGPLPKKSLKALLATIATEDGGEGNEELRKGWTMGRPPY